MPTRLILAFLSFITATSFLLAQTATGMIRGTVQERTGTVTINVHVRLVDEATNQSCEQTTHEESLLNSRLCQTASTGSTLNIPALGKR